MFQGKVLSCGWGLQSGMATMNPFDLLGDDDNEDPSQLIAAQKIVSKKAPAPTQAAAPAQQAKSAKLPSKPVPPAQAGELSFFRFNLFCNILF